LTKLFYLEPESRSLVAYLKSYERWVSCSIVRVEVHRTLRRIGAPAANADRARQRLATMELRDLTDELIAAAERTEPSELRALDSIHLATALELAPSLAAFVCYDRRLAAAAAYQGLPVVAPGADEVHEP
jgi:predicted nucleic acid-binding protein